MPPVQFLPNQTSTLDCCVVIRFAGVVIDSLEWFPQNETNAGLLSAPGGNVVEAK